MIQKTKSKLLALYKQHEEIANYLIVGGLTTVISIAVKYALLYTVLDASNEVQLQIAVIISWIVSVTAAYFMNRKWVFKSTEKNILLEAAKFYTARVGTLLVEMFLMWFFVNFLHLDSDAWVAVITLIVQVIIIIGNYILSKLFVFKHKSDKIKA